MASDADQVDDPYKQLRGQVQHAVGSGHFDRAIELLQSLSDATSPRMEGELFGGGASSIDQIFRLDSDFGFNLTKQTPPPPPSLRTSSLTTNYYPPSSADLSYGPLHETVMLAACAQGKPKAVISLLSLGANPNRPNGKGLTPLMKAAGAGHHQVVSILLAQPSVVLFSQDKSGRSALDWARIGDKRKSILLLEKAMEKDITSQRAAEFGKIKHQELMRTIERNQRYYELLIKFTTENNLVEVMKLVDNVPFDRKEYLETLVALELPHDPPETPYFIDVETDQGATPLMLACAQAEVINVEKLLAAGAKKDSENRRGHTALSWTCICGHQDVVTALIAGKVNATAASRLENKTPLQHAAYNGTTQCVAILLEHYFQIALDRRFNLSKKKLNKLEQWDMERNWMKPYEKLVLHKDIYKKTALEWATGHDLNETMSLLQAAEDRIKKRHDELTREDALALSVPCRLGCGYVDRADRIEKHEVQRCPKRIVGCEACGKNIPANTIPDHDANHCTRRIVRCENRYRGCEESMPFDQLFAHCKHRCMFRRDECRLCHRSLLHHQRDFHEAELCGERTVTCEPPNGLGCGIVIKAKDLREHCRHLCPNRPVKCRIGCGNKFPAKELKDHEQNFCLQPCSWEGCGRMIGPEDVRTLHEKFLCPRRVVKCPNCPIGGLVAERLETHLNSLCPKRKVKGLFDLDQILADQRPKYEEVEMGACLERMQRCRLNYIGRRISVRNANGTFETCQVVHYRESDRRFRIQFPDGFKWRSLAELDFVVMDDNNWDCGWVSESLMERHMNRDCKYRAVLCRLGCGQRVFERGRVKHEAEQCPKRQVTCPIGCGKQMPDEDLMDHTEHNCHLRNVFCGSCGLSISLPDLEVHQRTTCPLAMIRCPLGCGIELKVGQVEKHKEEECPKRLVTCKFCSDSGLFADELQGHLDGTLRDQECKMRKINCEHCGELVVAKDMEGHLANSCDKRIVICDCGASIVAENLSDHRILECPAVIRYCSLGCGEKMRVMDMPEHQKTTCKKRHLLAGKLLVCSLGCGAQVSFNEQFTHMTSICPKRIVECPNRCPEVVRFEEQEEHLQICRFRRVTCGNKAKTCLRQVRAWFYKDPETNKKGLVCCENHQNNALMYAVEMGETKLVNFMLEQTENRGLDFETPFGDTPLTKASQTGNVEMLKLLVGRAQADEAYFLSDFINYETCRGKTALSEAAKADKPEAIKFLVQKRAKIDHKTEFYRKTPMDWAANMGCDAALDELRRAYRVELDIRIMFVKITMGDIEFCKKMVHDGELYRLNHVKTLEGEVGVAREELKVYEADAQENLDALEKLKPMVEEIKATLDKNEVRVDNISSTADQLLERTNSLADGLQTGFTNAIIAMQHCEVSDVEEILAIKNPPEEILQVIKGLCLLKNVKPAEKRQGRELPPAASRPNSRPASRDAALQGGRGHGAMDHVAKMEDLMGYWASAKKLLKAKNLPHQLRYYTKSKTPPGCLQMIGREITAHGFLDYDLKYRLFLDLPVEQEREDSILGRNGTSRKSKGCDEVEMLEDDKKEEPDDVEPEKEPELEENGFAIIAALSKWIKAICNYAAKSQELEDTKSSEIMFREEFDVEIIKLKRERVDAEIAHFRIALLQGEIDDAQSRVRWAQRRIEGGEKKLQIAKLFAIVTPSGHSLLSWAAAWGNLEILDIFLDHGAYPGYGDEYADLCVRVFQLTYRHHVWKKNRPPWTKERAREYRSREMGFTFASLSMLDQMRKTREKIRMPLTEAFFNGQYHVLDSFEKKKVPMYHASLTNIMPSGVTPIGGDPAGNNPLEKPMNVVDCALLGKERHQGAVWVSNVGWQPPGCNLDPYTRGLEAAEEVWEHVNGIVEAGRAEMHKRRAIRQERELRREWGIQMDIAVKAADFPRMIFCAKEGALIDYQTSRGVTPLLRAAMEDPHAVNHKPCINDEGTEVTAVSYLLDRPTKRPMIDFEADIGHTALTFSCYHARLLAVEALLDRGCKINYKVKGGKTALHYAAMNGKAKVVDLLLERGADSSICDHDGKTPNDWAFERNFSEVLASFSKERLGNVGVGKANVGEANIKVPCAWGCGEFLVEGEKKGIHEAICGFRIVPCKFCDTTELQAREKEEHEAKLCGMRPTACLLCGEEMLAGKIGPHLKNDCQNRLERCKFCKEEVRFKAMQHHCTNICKQRKLPCPNDCGAEIPYAKMTMHKRQECSLRRVRCSQGCGQEMWAKNREEHENVHCPEKKQACEHCGTMWKKQQLLDHVLKCDQAPVKCSNVRYGCQWTGKSKLLRKHLDFACDHSYNKSCPLGCALKLRAVEIDEHVQKCERRMTECELCYEPVMVAQLGIHKKYECPQRRVPCGQCGEMVFVNDMIRHRDWKCKQRSVICTNTGCYLKLRLAEREIHERTTCRRAIVWCRLGCGNTMYLEKRRYHEEELCDYRFVECPLCGEQVRERDKLDHMEIECVRGGQQAVLEFHEQEEERLKKELEEKEQASKALREQFTFEKKMRLEAEAEEKNNPKADKHMRLKEMKEKKVADTASAEGGSKSPGIV